jgi:hypothetical protein
VRCERVQVRQEGSTMPGREIKALTDTVADILIGS